MSTRPKTVDTENWNDIKEFTPGIKCHTCDQYKEKVKKGLLMGVAEFGDNMLPANPTHWQMCQDCYDLGWLFGSDVSYGFIRYSILKAKSVKGEF